MQLTSYLDKGASLDASAPCLTMGGDTRSYEEVQTFSYQCARALAALGIAPGDKVAILSGNHPTAFSCVFGLARAGAVWCPVNPRNQAAENADLLNAADCRALIFHSAFLPMVEKIKPIMPGVSVMICIDKQTEIAPSLEEALEGYDHSPLQVDSPDDLAAMPGTGGTTGKPKLVQLTGRNIETMSALTLMGYPFGEHPVFAALAPLTHAAGILCFPILASGGHIIILPSPDLDQFLAAIETHKVTHTFLPPTVIYMLLDHPKLDTTDLSSLECFWYGAAPISVKRLEEALTRIGPMAQLYGQTEAPMMISMMSPADHLTSSGEIHRERLSSAGRVAPLVQLEIQDGEGKEVNRGERGEICVKGSLVMAGYYNNASANQEAFRDGWLRTGDIGYLDEEHFLYIVDRAKDMVITGGFNVYSVEVENAIRDHPSVQECAVIGLPDDKWGERVVAVVIPRADQKIDKAELVTHTKAKIGSVKAPKQVEVWQDLPRSRVGKVNKQTVRGMLLKGEFL